MPLFVESREKLYGQIMFDVVNNTNITRTSPGSKTRSIVEALTNKLGQMGAQFDLNVVQAFLDGAEGRYLDFWGNILNLPRLDEESATISAGDRVMKFYVDVGTFGDINGGSPILVTAGTIISSSPDGEGIRYRTIADTILSTDTDQGFVSAEAIRTGGSSNVAKNQLRYHDFTGYTDALAETLKVTNEADIVTGQDVELDSNYKFRLANQVIAAESSNIIAIRLAALRVPGVADVTLVPFHRGIGTIDLLIKSTTPSVSTTLISTVQNAVSSVTSQGILSTIRGPIEIGMSMVGTLTFRRRLSEEEEDNIISAVTANIINYINNLDIGEEFILNEVIERVLSTSELIKNLGSANKPLDNLFIHIPSRAGDNKNRQTLLGDYQPEIDAKLLVEGSFAGNTPILFRSILTPTV